MAKLLKDMTVAELKGYCRRLGLSVSGNKAALIARIEARVKELEAERKAEARKAKKAIAKAESLFEKLSAAVETGAVVEFDYTNRFGRMTTGRKIVPVYTYEVINKETGEVYQYVCGADFARRDFRNFNIDKMENVEFTDRVYKVKPLLYPADPKLAGRKPLKAYALTEREIERQKQRGWSLEPKVLRRPVFCQNGLAGDNPF